MNQKSFRNPKYKKTAFRIIIAAIFICIIAAMVLIAIRSEKKNNPVTSEDTSAAACEPRTRQKTDEASCDQKDADQLIRDIITYYGSYSEDADEQVNALINELSSIDKEQGRLWQDIIDYWKYANNELTINNETVPGGLPEDDTLAIVVLGFKLNDDGTMQNELIGRLNMALECAEHYPNAYVICTGGGTAAAEKSVTEAGQMCGWMKEQGIEPERIIIEGRSFTTAQNAKNTLDILNENYPQVDSVLIVSSGYHIPWGVLMFEAVFMKSASEGNLPQLHVVSDSAYPASVSRMEKEELLRWQAGGLMEIVGDNVLANKFYSNTFTKPEL